MRFIQTNEALALGYLRPGFAALCHLGNKAVSLSQDQRVATTDESLGVGSGGTGGSDEANTAGTSGWFSTTQAVRDEGTLISGSSNKFGDDFSGAKIQDGGVSLGGANSGTINVTNTATSAENIAKTFSDTVKELVAARPSTPSGAPLATDEEKKTDATTTTTESKTKLLAWVGGIVAFLVVGEILRRLFWNKAKKS